MDKIIKSIFVVFTLMCIFTGCESDDSRKTETMTLSKNKEFIQENFNLGNVEECVFTGGAVGNERSIGSCDYEYFIFAKSDDAEIKRIKNTYKFESVIPDFGVSPTPTQEKYEDFTDKIILSYEKYNWGYSQEYENFVMENTTYIGKVYFDTENNYVYMWVSTT